MHEILVKVMILDCSSVETHERNKRFTWRGKKQIHKNHTL